MSKIRELFLNEEYGEVIIENTQRSNTIIMSILNHLLQVEKELNVFMELSNNPKWRIYINNFKHSCFTITDFLRRLDRN